MTHTLGSEIAKIAFTGQLERLLDELEGWHKELCVDVTRAEQRGFAWLAYDLRRLAGRVDAVRSAGRALAPHAEG